MEQGGEVLPVTQRVVEWLVAFLGNGTALSNFAPFLEIVTGVNLGFLGLRRLGYFSGNRLDVTGQKLHRDLSAKMIDLDKTALKCGAEIINDEIEKGKIHASILNIITIVVTGVVAVAGIIVLALAGFFPSISVSNLTVVFAMLVFGLIFGAYVRV